MSETHLQLKEFAVEAINNLFSDRSVEPQDTAETLRELIQELEEMIESLQV